MQKDGSQKSDDLSFDDTDESSNVFAMYSAAYGRLHRGTVLPTSNFSGEEQ